MKFANEDMAEGSASALRASSSAQPHGVGKGDRCAGCASQDFRMLHEGGTFWVICKACGMQGPREASAYEAVMSWRGEAALPVRSMGSQVRIICVALGLLAAVVAMIGLILA